MKTFIKKLIYKGSMGDFIEDKISSNIAMIFDIFVSFLAAIVLSGILVVMEFVFKTHNIVPTVNDLFVFFVTVFILFMVALYSPSYYFQDKYLRKKKVSRPFYFITELKDDEIELKVDFDKDHRRTNKQYKINLKTIEGITACKNNCLTEERFINNGDFVKSENNPDIEFIRIDTNKVGSLSNIGNRKLSYIVPRYDDNGVDILSELYGLLEK